MENNNNYPKYKSFLESIDYSSTEVEKYFKRLIDGLRDEVVSILNDRDSEIEKAYNDYNSSLSLHDKIKYDIISKYLDEYKEINEKYNNEIIKLEAEYSNRKNELLDILEIKLDVERKIKSECLLEFYERKKLYQKHINEVLRKIDDEYEKHISIIFNAKEKILKHEEFYLNLENHLNEIEKNINFFNELEDYNNSLTTGNSDLKIESDENKLNIYINYLKEEKNNILKIEDFEEKYSLIDSKFNEAIKEIDIRHENLEKEFSNIKNDLNEKFESINKEIEVISLEYDQNIKKETNDEVIKNLNKKRDILLSSLNTKKETLALNSIIERDLLDKELCSIENFKNYVSSINDCFFDSYRKELEKNSIMLSETFGLLEDLLNDELRNIISLKGDSKNAKEIISYFKTRFEKIELSKRHESLVKYKEFLISSNEKNKKLDCLAYEILTNEELLKLKQLELKKEFLTIDDETKIKEIRYDMDIYEIDKIKNVSISILTTTNELELIKKDFEIDKMIQKNELENSISIIDLRKKIDILSSDYMIAYTRLENIKKIAEIKGNFDIKAIDVSSTIQLEKIIELALLDAINKKNNFESLVTKYDKEINELDEDNKQRIRYMNNVLEIERNNFEFKKNELKRISNDLETLVYPEIIEKKTSTTSLIKRVKKAYQIDKENLIKYNDLDKKNLEIVNNGIYETISNFENKLNDFIGLDENNFISFIQNDNFNIYVQNLLAELINKLNYFIDLFSYRKLVRFDIDLNSINKLVLKCKLIISKEKYNISEIKANVSSLILKLSNKYYKEFTKKISLIKPLNDRDLNKKLNELDNSLKNDIAMIAIENTEEIEDNLKDIDEVRDSKKKVQEQFEKDISEYKKSYIATINTIKNDYQEKYNELIRLKTTVIDENERCEEIIENTIKDASHKLDIDKLNKKSEIISTSSSNATQAKETIDNLSDDIKKKNVNFDKNNENINKLNQSFRDKMAVEAKQFFEKIDMLKNESINYINSLKDSKILNKELFLKKINNEAMQIKAEFENKNCLIEEEYSNLKADNIIEYSKLYNETVENEMKLHDEIRKPLTDYSSEVSSIETNLIEKVKYLEKTLSNEGEKAIIRMNDIIDNTISNIDSEK